jgi:hypothetical protein
VFVATSIASAIIGRNAAPADLSSRPALPNMRPPLFSAQPDRYRGAAKQPANVFGLYLAKLFG